MQLGSGISLAVVAALAGAAANAAESSFKAYGFADAQFRKQWYSDNNVLRRYG